MHKGCIIPSLNDFLLNHHSNDSQVIRQTRKETYTCWIFVNAYTKQGSVRLRVTGLLCNSYPCPWHFFPLIFVVKFIFGSPVLCDWGKGCDFRSKTLLNVLAVLGPQSHVHVLTGHFQKTYVSLTSFTISIKLLKPIQDHIYSSNPAVFKLKNTQVKHFCQGFLQIRIVSEAVECKTSQSSYKGIGSG